MKLGMPTMVENSSLIENVKYCSILGLDFIELNMNLPICTPESLSYKEIRNIKDQFGIDFSVHLPEELDLASYHPPIRKGHLERCKQAMEWANLSGIKTLNMHINSGIYFTLPDTKVWINQKYENQFLDLLIESCSELYQLAITYEVDLCIENTSNFHLPFIQKALEQLSLFSNFHLTWDVGHDAKTGFTEQPIFARYKNHIRHMHLHDYNGKSDHQILYTGCVPIDDRLNLAKDFGLSVVIEVKTNESLSQSVSELKRNGYVS